MDMSASSLRALALISFVFMPLLMHPVFSECTDLSDDSSVIKCLFDQFSEILSVRKPEWNEDSMKKECPYLSLAGIRCGPIDKVDGKEVFAVTEVNFKGFGLEGEIPTYLIGFRHLRYLRLDGCSFTGEIPSEFGELDNLESLFLGRNKLTGTIPIDVLQLPRLKGLYLNDNQLTGYVPEFSSRIDHLILSGNMLSFSCPPSKWTQAPYLACVLSGNPCQGFCSQSNCVVGSCIADSGLYDIGESSNGKMTVSNPIKIVGDLTGSESDVMVIELLPNMVPEKPIISVGCFEFTGKLVISVSDEVFKILISGSGHDEYLLIRSECDVSSSLELFDLKSPDVCSRLTGEIRTDQKGDNFSYFITFKPSHVRCNLWWIITSSVVGIILVAVIVLLVVNPKNMIRPKIKVYY